jgi:hypothetical protein
VHFFWECRYLLKFAQSLTSGLKTLEQTKILLSGSGSIPCFNKSVSLILQFWVVDEHCWSSYKFKNLAKKISIYYCLEALCFLFKNFMRQLPTAPPTPSKSPGFVECHMIGWLVNLWALQLHTKKEIKTVPHILIWIQICMELAINKMKYCIYFWEQPFLHK